MNWDAIACACGCPVEEIPLELVGIFEQLDEKIKEVNGLSFQSPENFGLRSTQVIGLVVLLWQLGVLKGGDAHVLKQ